MFFEARRPEDCRVWCRLCSDWRPLLRIYWWRSLGRYCGECVRCGNTVSMPREVPRPAEERHEPDPAGGD